MKTHITGGNAHPENADFSMKSSSHLKILRDKLPKNNEQCFFPCIKDLVANGLKLERFQDGTNPPSRQDITQYMASWCKYIGMSADDCREWMIEYCINVLSALSSSSPSGIRHSTKSNIRYIYNSDVSFECRLEKNPFKARCDSQCPLYEEMARAEEANDTPNSIRPFERTVECKTDNELADYIPPVKEVYSEQFEKATDMIKGWLDQGIPKTDIIKLLDERGLKTRTGKKWSYSTLGHEIRRINTK